jgi:lipoprotein-releasing system permease protein
MIGAMERFIAFRYLRAKRKEGFVSVIAGFSFAGIGLGVATLIIVMAVMNGFRQDLLGRILGLNGHFTVTTATNRVFNADAVSASLTHVQGIVSAVPVVEGQVMATADGGGATGAIVRGISRADLQHKTIIGQSLQGGDFQAFQGKNAVIIGYRLARKLGLMLGDDITLISPKGNVTAFGAVPRLKSYRIVGVFDVGMYEYDSAFIYMPMAAAQIYFRTGKAVTHIDVVTDDPDQVDTYIKQALPAVPAGTRLRSWKNNNAAFFNALQVERNVMFLILTLIILVAAFNIVSGMIMMVKDKARDIAILRTMGATRGMIMRIFFISGASVGVAGTLFGFVLGVAFCNNIEAIRRGLESLTGTDLFSAEIYFLSKIPAQMNPTEVAYVVLMALGLSFAASVYPAWRASRLDPVEALRYE